MDNGAFTVSRSSGWLIVNHAFGHEYSYPTDGRRVLDEWYAPAAARLSNEQLSKVGLPPLDLEQSFLQAKALSGDARRAAETFLSTEAA